MVYKAKRCQKRIGLVLCYRADSVLRFLQKLDAQL